MWLCIKKKKNPTKGNQTKPFFFPSENVLHPNSIFNHGSVLYWHGWAYILCSSLVCFSELLSSTGGLSDECATAHSGVGSGQGINETLLLIYQQNLLLLFMDLNIYCSETESRVGQEKGKRSAPETDTDFIQKTWQGTNPLTFSIKRQARWFSHRSNRLDTTMRQHKVHIWA